MITIKPDDKVAQYVSEGLTTEQATQYAKDEANQTGPFTVAQEPVNQKMVNPDINEEVLKQNVPSAVGVEAPISDSKPLSPSVDTNAPVVDLEPVIEPVIPITEREDTAYSILSSPTIYTGGPKIKDGMIPNKSRLTSGYTLYDQLYDMEATEIQERLDFIKSEEKFKPTGLEAFGAAMSTTPTWGWVLRVGMPDYPPVAGYSPFDIVDGVSNIDGYFGHAEVFMESKSPEETEILKQRVDAENFASKTIQRYGGKGAIALTIGAELVDPTGIAYLALPPLRAATLANFGKIVLADSAVTTVAEITRQQTQELITWKSVGDNIIGSMLISGGTIAGLNLLPSALKKGKMRDTLDKLVRENPEYADPVVTNKIKADLEKGIDEQSVIIKDLKAKKVKTDAEVKQLKEATNTHTNTKNELAALDTKIKLVQKSKLQVMDDAIDENNTAIGKLEQEDVDGQTMYAEPADYAELEAKDITLGIERDYTVADIAYRESKALLAHAKFTQKEAAKKYAKKDSSANKTELDKADANVAMREAETKTFSEDVEVKYEILLDTNDYIGGSVGANLSDVAPQGIRKLPDLTNNLFVKTTRAMGSFITSTRHFNVNSAGSKVINEMLANNVKYVDALENIKNQEDNLMRVLAHNLQRAMNESVDKEKAKVQVMNHFIHGSPISDPVLFKHAKAVRADIKRRWEEAGEEFIDGTYYMDGDTKVAITFDEATSDMFIRYDLAEVRDRRFEFEAAWIVRESRRHTRIQDELRIANPKHKRIPFDKVEANRLATISWANLSKLYADDFTGASTLLARMQGDFKQIPFEHSELREFIVLDPLKAYEGIGNTLTPKTIMMRKFGSLDMAEQIAWVDSEAILAAKSKTREIIALEKEIVRGDSSLATAVKLKLSIQARKSIKIRAKRDIEEIIFFMDRLLNKVIVDKTYIGAAGEAAKGGIRAIKGINVALMLGGVVVSSLSEMAKQISKYGLLPFAYQFARGIKNFNVKIGYVDPTNLKDVISMLERQYDVSVVKLLGEDNIPNLSGIGGGVDKLSQGAMKLSGLTHWNDLNKSVAVSLFGNAFGRALKGNDIDKFTKLGFSLDEITEMQRAFKKYGDEGNLNVDRWDTDIELINKIDRLALAEADNMVVTPSMGDKPIMLNGPIRSLFTQFMSFGFATWSKTVMPLGTGTVAEGLKYVFYVTTLSMGVVMLKDKLAGRDIDYSKDPKLLITKALGATGLFAIQNKLYSLMVVNFGYDPLGVDPTGVKYSRFGSAFPTQGTYQNIKKAISAGSSDKVRRKARGKLIPTQNNPILGPIMDKIENNIYGDDWDK